MRVIGLTGPARSGKDTVAEIIAEALPGEVHRQGFADALKVSAARALGFDGDTAACVRFCNALKGSGGSVTTYLPQDRLDDPSFVTSGRSFLQRYGTEAHRDVFGQDFWLDAVLPEGRDDCDTLLIPDVRFDNEAQRVLDRGGEVWAVRRPGVEAINGHSSEGGVPAELVSRTIDNSGSLTDLRRAVEAELLAVAP